MSRSAHTTPTPYFCSARRPACYLTERRQITMMRLTALWTGLAFVASQECTCTKDATIKTRHDEATFVFVGKARLAGNEVRGLVMRPVKGCLETGQTLTLMTSPDCPISAPPIDKVSLFTGRKYSYPNATFAVVLDSCGIQTPVSEVNAADMTWINKQVEMCDGAARCPSGAAPLSCRACSSSTGCGGPGCVRNPCNACTSQSDTCGNYGGQAFEAKRLHAHAHTQHNFHQHHPRRHLLIEAWLRALGVSRPWVAVAGAPRAPGTRVSS